MPLETLVGGSIPFSVGSLLDTVCVKKLTVPMFTWLTQLGAEHLSKNDPSHLTLMPTVKKNWQGRPPKRGGIPHRPRDGQDNQQNDGFHEYNDYEEFPAPFWKKHNSDGSPQPPSTSNFLGLSKQIQEMAFTLKNIQEEWKGMKGLSAKPTTPPYPPNPSQWSPADIQNQTMYKTVPESSQIWY